jgi:hypothetical protein
MRATSIVVCLVGLILLSASVAEARTWTRKNGKQIEGEFVKLEQQSDGKNMVTLRKPDGSEMTVRLGNLSDEDRKYVKQLTNSQGKPENNEQVGQKPANQPATPTNTEMRKWTRKNGKEFDAEFIKREGPVVTLKKPDGSEMTVKMGGLSDGDRKYVKQLTQAAPVGKTEVVAPEAPADTSVSELPDQPPVDSSQQREWLRAHILKDSQFVGTFGSDTTAKVSTTLQSVPDDQVSLLCQYYLLTRSKTEQDAYLYSLQQQGNTEQQVNEAKAPVADLLTEMQNQGDACYSQIQTLGEPAQYLAQIEYASVPGWCVSSQCYVPGWYYDNGSFVGPCGNARYCGVYAASVYHAYHDTGSRFYKAYHSVGDSVYRRHTAQIAQHSAKYFHEHDYHRALAHDRLLKPSSPLRHAGQHDAHLSHASERGKPATKSASTSKPATKSASASKTAAKSASTSKTAAKSASTSKTAAKSASTSKPATKSASASKTAAKSASTSKTAAKSASANKPAAKSASANKPAAKSASASKTAAKSASANKPAAKSASTNKPAAKSASANKPAAKSASANKPATKQEKK